MALPIADFYLSGMILYLSGLIIPKIPKLLIVNLSFRLSIQMFCRNFVDIFQDCRKDTKKSSDRNESNLMHITHNTKLFVFLSPGNIVTRDSLVKSNGMCVHNILPLIIYMFGVALLLLLPETLFL